MHHPSESISLEIYMRVRMNHQSIDYVLYERKKRIGFHLPRTRRTIGICKHHIPERFPHFTRKTIGKIKQKNSHTDWIETNRDIWIRIDTKVAAKKKSRTVAPRPHPHELIQINNSEFRFKKKNKTNEARFSHNWSTTLAHKGMAHKKIGERKNLPRNLHRSTR